MLQLNDTARSLRTLSDLLGRHPEATVSAVAVPDRWTRTR